MKVQVERAIETALLTDAEIERNVLAALAHGGRPDLAVQVVLVDDSTLADLHARFLGDASPTDVMAFDLGQEGEGPEAEIYASVECAERVARQRGVPPARELALYLVHGSLHLCGHDDHGDEERARMRAAERSVLDGLGWAPDLAPHDE